MCLDDLSVFGNGPMNEPQCPPGECRDFWSDTDEYGVTRLLCGWCGKEQDGGSQPCSGSGSA